MRGYQERLPTGLPSSSECRAVVFSYAESPTDIATGTISIQHHGMREGSVLAPSATFGSLMRVLGDKLRRSIESLSNLRAHSADEQQPEDVFEWQEAYKAALLEFSERRASVAINEAMKAIERRRRMLRFAPKSAHEWGLLERATSTLLTIRAYRVLPPNPQDVGNHDARRIA
jgi:hypothetical protein